MPYSIDTLDRLPSISWMSLHSSTDSEWHPSRSSQSGGLGTGCC